ncbi:MAG: ATP-binding cassette domain-containing protein, partial [Nitrospirota bacterium]
DIEKRFGGRTVLSGVSCTLSPGEISAVIGPNGSGKTTLMRIIARLEGQDGGSVTYMSGEGEAALSPGLELMRRMTFIPQNPLLFRATLYNNIAFGLKARGVKGWEVARRVREALEAGGLWHLSGEQGQNLSGGEAQRAAIIRAYALRPELIMLDEPSSNLDPEGGVLMERLMLEMAHSGAAVVLVTHNLFQARRLSDRVFFMYGGRLVESGTPKELFTSPKDELTRKFISGEVVF